MSPNSNGSPKEGSSRALPCGIYAPTVTFFDPNTEELDIATIKHHALRLAKAGLAGIVTMGSNGEAVHCTREEKMAVTRATREALEAGGFQQTPIIVGATEGSVKGTLELCKMSQQAGGDYVLLLPPSYYRPLMDDASIQDYFLAIANESPLPIVLYNYPGAVAGIDMSSDTLIRLANHPNIVGAKFTCGNTGKLTRVATAAKARTPGSEGSGFMAFGGMCDFTTQTLISGGSGIIAGGANVMPKACVRVWDLYVEGRIAEAIELQKVVAACDWVLTRSSIPGTKSALQSYFGYGGYGRRPLKRVGSKEVKEIEDGIKAIMDIEKGL